MFPSGSIGSVRGRGRGRARGMVKEIATVIMSGVDIENGKSVPARQRCTISEMAKQENLIESSSEGKATSPARVIVKAEAVPVAFSEENGPICVKILKVNIPDKYAYVLVEDNESNEYRRELDLFIQSMYTSSESRELRVAFKDVINDEILVLGDEHGKFHRAKILQVDKAKGTGTAIDVDTYEMLTIEPNSVFELTPGLCKVPLQAVKCRATYDENKMFMQWIKENDFILRNKMILENSLLSALEMAEGKWAMANSIKKIQEGNEQIPLFSFKVLGSQALLKFWFVSIIYQTVPRMPPFGLKKVAMINHISRNGEVQIVIPDLTWRGIREAIHDIQMKHLLLSPRCASKARFHYEMVESYKTNLFLAPMDDDWTELFRVKVTKTENPKNVLVRYLDVGIEKSIPIENLAAPLQASFMPELLSVIPPLAVCAQLDIHDHIEVAFCKVLGKELKSKPCYLKMKDEKGIELTEDLDKPPIVDLQVLVYGSVESVTYLVNGPDINGTEGESKESEYIAEPLINLLKQLDEFDKKRQETFERVKNNCILRCDCESCLDKRMTL